MGWEGKRRTGVGKRNKGNGGSRSEKREEGVCNKSLLQVFIMV